MSVGFDYSNTSDRPPGPVLQLVARIFPGVRAVQDQVGPYAADWRAANLAALAAPGPLWVALGDSMSQGVGASAFDRGWVGQLDERLSAGGWSHRVVNLSVTGARIEDVIERQLPALRSLIEQGVEPALVTVLIGSNDVVSPRIRPGMASRFEEMLDLLPPRPVVANLPNPHREALRIDAMLRERAHEDDLVLADMRIRGPRSWRGRLSADKFHPNDRGYAAMVRVFVLALREAGFPGAAERPGQHAHPQG